MKMISNTSMISAIGVTLMSLVTLPVVMCLATDLSPFLQEVIDQFRRGIVHLDCEGFDPVCERVKRPHCGHRHKQPERRRHESFCNTARDCGDTGGLLGLHALER